MKVTKMEKGSQVKFDQFDKFQFIKRVVLGPMETTGDERTDPTE
jgi:hypothetical protein